MVSCGDHQLLECTNRLCTIVVGSYLVRLVHIAPESQRARIRANGIRATRVLEALLGGGHNRAVWAFPVLASYTLTHSWGRELKRGGAHALVAVSFRIDDDEPVYARHFSNAPAGMTAASAVDLIRAAVDPRGYEIIVPRRIAPSEITTIKVLPKAIGWRYWPEAKNLPLRMCDCPMCMPSGEVKARRYRERVKSALAELEMAEND